MIFIKFSDYIYLFLAILMGVIANGLLKATNGFANLPLTLLSIFSIIFCLYLLAKAMSTIPVGFAYSTYSALTIIFVTFIGFFKYNQIPNIYSLLGIFLIILGVIFVNFFGKINV